MASWVMPLFVIVAAVLTPSAVRAQTLTTEVDLTAGRSTEPARYFRNSSGFLARNNPAWSRSARPSLSRMWPTCFFTVGSLIRSEVEISLFD